MNTFLQIHFLTGFSGVLLNRDENGFAKRLPVGGTSRIRVSSQSLKRHWRTADDQWALKMIGAPMSTRSRQIIEEHVLPEVQDIGDDVVIESIRVAMSKVIYGKKGAEKKDRQALLLGKPEIDYLIKIAKEAAAAAVAAVDAKSADAAIEQIINEHKASLKIVSDSAGKISYGLESALFGRMVTSDTQANTDAAIHVAHAFTVAGEEAETDYFTVVDDLESGSGSGGIFETELTSGLFYGYVVVDTRKLIENLGGDKELAGKVVEHLIHLIATVSPGAKLGSTAPYGYADLVLIEAGQRQPRSLANAFRVAIGNSADHDDHLSDAIDALESHLDSIDRVYGQHEKRSMINLAGRKFGGVEALVDLDTLASDAAKIVASA